MKRLLMLVAAAMAAVFAIAAQASAQQASGAVPGGMARVEGGTFDMGGRSVTVCAFYMDARLVTQREWLELMGTTLQQQRDAAQRDQGWMPGFAGEGDNHPMYNVSWFEAAEFANRRSQRSGLTPAYAISGTGANRVVTWNRAANGYRLPTEAEWEFAARGGTACGGNFRYSGSDVASEVAWHMGNSGGGAQPVGTLRPNALGIYDMSGNLWEWVWDRHGRLPTGGQATNPEGAPLGSFRVARGGSWVNSPEHVRSANRTLFGPSRRYLSVGFRLVRPAD